MRAAQTNLIFIEKINVRIVHASPKFSFGDTSEYNRFRLLRTINVPFQVEKPAYCTMFINKFATSSGVRSMKSKGFSRPQKTPLADWKI